MSEKTPAPADSSVEPNADVETTDSASPKKRTRSTGYPFLFRLLHWALAVSMIVLFATGLSLHAVARPEWSLFSGSLPGWLWSGPMQWLHLVAATIFTIGLLAVVWIYSRRKVRRRATHIVLLAGGLVMVATAQLLLHPVGSMAVYSAARVTHWLGAIVLFVALAWHTVTGLSRFRKLLVPAFHPWAQAKPLHLLYFLPVVLVGICLVLNGLPMKPSWRELVVHRVDASAGNVEISMDDLPQLPWNTADPTTIKLVNGVGFEQGQTEVTLRALHDGEELFVLAEWLDPVEDRRYWPWEKTADGWNRLISSDNDERIYYEDKFSLLFPVEPNWKFDRQGCAIYCHANGEYGYGYKYSDHLVDVWHWKASRTDPVGQVDDKYWLTPDMSSKEMGRYADPKEGGGYEKNLTDDKTRPAYLPDDPSSVRLGAIPREHAVEYTPEAASKITPGTLVPGLVHEPFEGDRGDVRCVSRYEAGRWQLYMRRKLDTQSEFDTHFVPGGEFSFGCAAFDHCAKRHAYSPATYRMRLEE